MHAVQYNVPLSAPSGCCMPCDLHGLVYVYIMMDILDGVVSTTVHGMTSQESPSDVVGKVFFKAQLLIQMTQAESYI